MLRLLHRFSYCLLLSIVLLLSACGGSSSSISSQSSSTSSQSGSTTIIFQDTSATISIKNLLPAWLSSATAISLKDKVVFRNNDLSIQSPISSVVTNNAVGQKATYPKINQTVHEVRNGVRYLSLIDSKTIKNGYIITLKDYTSADIKKDSYYPFRLGLISTQYSHQKHAVDTHAVSAKVYQMMKTYLNINSFDNKGSNMLNIIDTAYPKTKVKVSGCSAAIESGSSFNAFYQKGTAYYTPKSTWKYDSDYALSASADVIAHEWAHGITDSYSKLKYQNESGALNEAFSDWVGMAYDHFDSQSKFNIVRIGEQNKALRYANNPTLVFHPIRYKGLFWKSACKDSDCSFCNDYGGVHTNSSVANLMFYRLIYGFQFNGLSIAGLGMKRAITIAMQTNKNYWNRTTTFCQAKEGMKLAALTSEKDTIDKAWVSVGVTISACQSPVSPTTSTQKFNVYNALQPKASNKTYIANSTHSASNLSATINHKVAQITNSSELTSKITIGSETHQFMGSFSSGELKSLTHSNRSYYPRTSTTFPKSATIGSSGKNSFYYLGIYLGGTFSWQLYSGYDNTAWLQVVYKFPLLNIIYFYQINSNGDILDDIAYVVNHSSKKLYSLIPSK